MFATIILNYSKLRLRFFVWRSEAAIWKKILLSFAGALFMGILAQLKIYLPWTPVPIVGSTFGVVLSAVLLGRNWGGISTLIYILLGAMGIPWFAGFSGGVGIIFGPTGGYILGFLISGFFVGYVVDKFQFSRRLLPLILIMLLAHFVLMYIPGLIQLGLWMSLVKGKTFNLIELLWAGAIPFIPGDIVKSILAALVCYFITPKENYIAKK